MSNKSSKSSSITGKNRLSLYEPEEGSVLANLRDLLKIRGKEEGFESNLFSLDGSEQRMHLLGKCSDEGEGESRVSFCPYCLSPLERYSVVTSKMYHHFDSILQDNQRMHFGLHLSCQECTAPIYSSFKEQEIIIPKPGYHEIHPSRGDNVLWLGTQEDLRYSMKMDLVNLSYHGERVGSLLVDFRMTDFDASWVRDLDRIADLHGIKA